MNVIISIGVKPEIKDLFDKIKKQTRYKNSAIFEKWVKSTVCDADTASFKTVCDTKESV